MFTPNPDRTFSKQVSFNVPTESGRFQSVSLKVDYKGIDREALRDLQENHDDDDVYDRCVTGVHGVGNEGGQELSPADGKQAMKAEPAFVFQALMTLYDSVLGGNLKGKSSRRQRATG